MANTKQTAQKLTGSTALENEPYSAGFQVLRQICKESQANYKKEWKQH